MHRLLEINASTMTRYVKLEDCNTKKIENCFDDSDIKYENQADFSFMKIGCLYKCKILLFGVIIMGLESYTKNNILCTHSNECVWIGKYQYLKIYSKTEEYYIEKKLMVELGEKREFWFQWSRKDLIQVDDIVNPRCLR